MSYFLTCSQDVEYVIYDMYLTIKVTILRIPHFQISLQTQNMFTNTPLFNNKRTQIVNLIFFRSRVIRFYCIVRHNIICATYVWLSPLVSPFGTSPPPVRVYVCIVADIVDSLVANVYPTNTLYMQLVMNFNS